VSGPARDELAEELEGPATDLAAEARALLDQPRLARIVKRRRAVLPFPIKGGRIYLFNNNPLLRTGYPGTIGDFRDARVKKTVFSDDLNGRIQDALVLVRGAIC